MRWRRAECWWPHLLLLWMIGLITSYGEIVSEDRLNSLQNLEVKDVKNVEMEWSEESSLTQIFHSYPSSLLLRTPTVGVPLQSEFVVSLSENCEETIPTCLHGMEILSVTSSSRQLTVLLYHVVQLYPSEQRTIPFVYLPIDDQPFSATFSILTSFSSTPFLYTIQAEPAENRFRISSQLLSLQERTPSESRTMKRNNRFVEEDLATDALWHRLTIYNNEQRPLRVLDAKPLDASWVMLSDVSSSDSRIPFQPSLSSLSLPPESSVHDAIVHEKRDFLSQVTDSEGIPRLNLDTIIPSLSSVSILHFRLLCPSSVGNSTSVGSTARVTFIQLRIEGVGNLLVPLSGRCKKSFLTASALQFGQILPLTPPIIETNALQSHAQFLVEGQYLKDRLLYKVFQESTITLPVFVTNHGNEFIEILNVTVADWPFILPVEQPLAYDGWIASLAQEKVLKPVVIPPRSSKAAAYISYAPPTDVAVRSLEELAAKKEAFGRLKGKMNLQGMPSPKLPNRSLVLHTNETSVPLVVPVYAKLLHGGMSLLNDGLVSFETLKAGSAQFTLLNSGDEAITIRSAKIHDCLFITESSPTGVDDLTLELVEENEHQNLNLDGFGKLDLNVQLSRKSEPTTGICSLNVDSSAGRVRLLLYVGTSSLSFHTIGDEGLESIEFGGEVSSMPTTQIGDDMVKQDQSVIERRINVNVGQLSITHPRDIRLVLRLDTPTSTAVWLKSATGSLRVCKEGSHHLGLRPAHSANHLASLWRFRVAPRTFQSCIHTQKHSNNPIDTFRNLTTSSSAVSELWLHGHSYNILSIYLSSFNSVEKDMGKCPSLTLETRWERIEVNLLCEWISDDITLSLASLPLSSGRLFSFPLEPVKLLVDAKNQHLTIGHATLFHDSPASYGAVYGKQSPEIYNVEESTSGLDGNWVTTAVERVYLKGWSLQIRPNFPCFSKGFQNIFWCLARLPGTPPALHRALDAVSSGSYSSHLDSGMSTNQQIPAGNNTLLTPKRMYLAQLEALSQWKVVFPFGYHASPLLLSLRSISSSRMLKISFPPLYPFSLQALYNPIVVLPTVNTRKRSRQRFFLRVMNVSPADAEFSLIFENGENHMNVKQTSEDHTKRTISEETLRTKEGRGVSSCKITHIAGGFVKRGYDFSGERVFPEDPSIKNDQDAMFKITDLDDTLLAEEVVTVSELSSDGYPDALFRPGEIDQRRLTILQSILLETCLYETDEIVDDDTENNWLWFEHFAVPTKAGGEAVLGPIWTTLEDDTPAEATIYVLHSLFGYTPVRLVFRPAANAVRLVTNTKDQYSAPLLTSQDADFVLTKAIEMFRNQFSLVRESIMTISSDPMTILSSQSVLVGMGVSSGLPGGGDAHHLISVPLSVSMDGNGLFSLNLTAVASLPIFDIQIDGVSICGGSLHFDISYNLVTLCDPTFTSLCHLAEAEIVSFSPCSSLPFILSPTQILNIDISSSSFCQTQRAWIVVDLLTSKDLVHRVDVVISPPSELSKTEWLSVCTATGDLEGRQVRWFEWIWLLLVGCLVMSHLVKRRESVERWWKVQRSTVDTKESTGTIGMLSHPLQVPPVEIPPIVVPVAPQLDTTDTITNISQPNSASSIKIGETPTLDIVLENTDTAQHSPVVDSSPSIKRTSSAGVCSSDPCLSIPSRTLSEWNECEGMESGDDVSVSRLSVSSLSECSLTLKQSHISRAHRKKKHSMKTLGAHFYSTDESEVESYSDDSSVTVASLSHHSSVMLMDNELSHSHEFPENMIPNEEPTCMVKTVSTTCEKDGTQDASPDNIYLNMNGDSFVTQEKLSVDLETPQVDLPLIGTISRTQSDTVSRSSGPSDPNVECLIASLLAIMDDDSSVLSDGLHFSSPPIANPSLCISPPLLDDVVSTSPFLFPSPTHPLPTYDPWLQSTSLGWSSNHNPSLSHWTSSPFVDPMDTPSPNLSGLSLPSVIGRGDSSNVFTHSMGPIHMPPTVNRAPPGLTQHFPPGLALRMPPPDVNDSENESLYRY